MSWQHTHQKALEIGTEFKRRETELIDILQQVEKDRVFEHLGLSSLFHYCTSELHLTEEQSYTYIRIARASKKIPAIKQAIENKTLSVTNAKKIASVITPETQEDWLNKAQSLTSRELDKEIVKLHPKKALTERIKPITESLYELRCALSPEAEKLLKQAQDICKKNLGETLEVMLKDFVKRHDPVKKAERSLKRPAQPVSKPVHRNGKRTPVPAALKHAAVHEANAQCSHINPNGQRCPNRRYLQLHHCKPVAIGGAHELSNLLVLCSQHHRAVHRSQSINGSPKK